MIKNNLSENLNWLKAHLRDPIILVHDPGIISGLQEQYGEQVPFLRPVEQCLLESIG